MLYCLLGETLLFQCLHFTCTAFGGTALVINLNFEINNSLASECNSEHLPLESDASLRSTGHLIKCVTVPGLKVLS